MKTRRLSWLGPIAAILLTTACAQTDEGITKKIRAKIAVDETVKTYQIEVTTHDRVVTLKGNIDSEVAKERALSLAKQTQGVVEVKDMIAVKRETGGGDSPDPGRAVGVTNDDEAITLRVKSRLLDDPLVKGLPIDVHTRDGVVYLTGDVQTEQEKEQAITAARGTKGVKDVQANLRMLFRSVGNG